MSLNSKEVKMSSGVGSSEFIQMLIDPTSTQRSLDIYAASPEGTINIASLNSIPEHVLLMNDNINRIITSTEIRKSIFGNIIAGASITFIDGVIDAIAATPSILEEFYDSVVNRELRASGRIVHLLSNPKYMELSLVDVATMRIIAGDPDLLTMAFSTTENRTRIFDEGGSEIAVILLRESTFARQWLWDNASTIYRHFGNQRRTLNKRCYYLGQRGRANSTRYVQLAGTFIGDHRDGEVSLSTVSSNWVEINERCNPMTQRQTADSSSWWTEACYVEME